jgi:mRNA-degrading endonuclease RelE of RelBE toxin-antitoxin system/ribosomal protein L29
VTVNKNELKLVLDKLDTVKLELLRLRAMLLPEEEATEEEKKEIKEAKREIARGSKTNLEDLIKEMGWQLSLFEVTVAQRARKGLKRLPEHYKRRVIELLLILRENPVPAEYYDIKKLKGYTNTYRTRIGDIRVIYEISWNRRAIDVLLIEPRESVYSWKP